MLLPLLDALASKRIVLASASANRKLILEKAGLSFETSASAFAEDLPHSEFATPAAYVVKTSEMKLLDKLRELCEKGEKAHIVIAADTIIALGSEIVEKPADAEHAAKMLRRYNDFEHHSVLTSVWVALVDPESMEVLQQENVLNETKVFFEHLDEATIKAYVESGEPFGKAGAYGIQGQAATFIRKIEGCYYSVWGFPLSDFCRLLRQMLMKPD